jgi:hypothetical protein
VAAGRHAVSWDASLQDTLGGIRAMMGIINGDFAFPFRAIIFVVVF